ncbi:hypothetical protein Tco_0853938 [Tanacetum coccineum]
MSAIPPRIEDALAFITPISKGNSVLRIISRIVLAVATYYLWNERNSRLFKKRVSFAEQRSFKLDFSSALQSALITNHASSML